MSEIFLILPIIIPMFAGLVIAISKNGLKGICDKFATALIFVNAVIIWGLIITCGKEGLALFRLTPSMVIVLRFDSLGRFFAGIIATLWPITACYAYGYMKHEINRRMFYTFFLMAFGATAGITMSGNFITMYCFYELLTFMTLPLVMHYFTKKDMRAGRYYMIVSLGGAAVALMGIVYLGVNGIPLDFVYGGHVTAQNGGTVMMNATYVAMFFGLGVKAAVFPMYKWLPKAAVAPTPVTALLHAVAVVKSGAFAIMRLTYFCYGTETLINNWPQYVTMAFAIFTILFGSSMALKQIHWKRSLAYSTVANLSYILFGVTMMTEAGFTGALLHMLFHAIIKILSFFCAGAVLHTTGKEYRRDLEGLGRQMPVTFGCFTVSALALTGIPPLCGFVSKFQLLSAAVNGENPLAYAGAVILIVSAFLTAVYMMLPATHAFFPQKGNAPETVKIHETELSMLVPMIILAIAVVLLGIFAQPFVELTENIAAGL